MGQVPKNKTSNFQVISFLRTATRRSLYVYIHKKLYKIVEKASIKFSCAADATTKSHFDASDLSQIPTAQNYLCTLNKMLIISSDT